MMASKRSISWSYGRKENNVFPMIPTGACSWYRLS
jgi:hypothetical protein